MSFMGTLRALNAAANRAERAQRRRQRELENERKLLSKMSEMAQASFEVNEYENRIEVLQTVHKESNDKIDWQSIVDSSPPQPPVKNNKHENGARQQLLAYRPSLNDKLLRRVEKKNSSLKLAVDKAIKKDEESYKGAIAEYESLLSEWKTLTTLAKGILANDVAASNAALNHFNSFFVEVRELDAEVEAKRVDGKHVDTEVYVRSDVVVPKERKSLLKSGKLSVKPMPKGQFNEIYQDYVSSIVLRVAREIIAILPIEMVLVTAYSDLLNSGTGHVEKQPILSVAIPRDTADRLNFELLDPSDSLSNFVYKMNFKKTNGFQRAEKIDIKALSSVA